MGQLLLMSSSHIRLSFYIISTLLLFYALQITQQGKERWLVLSQRLKIKAFAKNVKMLLESQPDGVIALGNFVSTYMKFFGQKCKIATFGFSKLTDLIEAVPNVVKVCLFLDILMQSWWSFEITCLLGVSVSDGHC